MANRVVGQEVKDIIDTEKTSSQVDPYITSAHLVVDQHLLGQGLSEALLTEIERWLSAHFVAVDDKQEDFVWIGDSRARFGGKFGLGLDFTAYGQQVKLLDPTGALAALGKPKASFTVVGESTP